ncbi:MAG: phosphoglucosamine mutase [Candidatus Acidiferrales bacterium]
MAKLFGTDGIRGVAGEPPLDARTIFAVGRVVGEFLRESGARGSVLLAKDTRESSPWVASYLAAGLRAARVDAVSAGVLPTPGVARLVRVKAFAAGAVVSASHNPYRDNGIKLISSSGMKFPDDIEARLEERIERLLGATKTPEPFVPPIDLTLAEEYLEALKQATRRELPAGLGGLRLVVDCANGAATRVAPQLFGDLDAAVTAIHSEPDGRNINEGCGALHPEVMAEKVAAAGADLGVAFDGDADRALFAAASGRVVNGDGILLLAARAMKRNGALRGGVVVGTVMANLGLEVALKRDGLGLVRTAVGDRYVLEEMLRRGANLGGEQSGHIIFLDDSPAGDGLLTALKVLAVVRATGKGLDELTSDLKVFPQVLRNLRVREKVPFEKVPRVKQAIAEAKAALGERGRVVVRYSGTEPLARVMVEAETDAEVERWTQHISAAIEATLGGS